MNSLVCDVPKWMFVLEKINNNSELCVLQLAHDLRSESKVETYSYVFKLCVLLRDYGLICMTKTGRKNNIVVTEKGLILSRKVSELFTVLYPLTQVEMTSKKTIERKTKCKKTKNQVK